MAVIDSFEVGGTTYDLNAAALETPATIDGISFDGNESVTRYAACATAGATAAKVVTLGTDLTLAPGATVVVRFNSANTAENPTLNVNGTGAFPIVAYGSTASASGAWAAGETVTFVYDGTNWNQIGGAVGSASAYGRLMLDDTFSVPGAAADSYTLGLNAFIYRGTVSGNTDLNDLKTPGAYNLTSSSTGLLHLPTSYTQGTAARLLVFRGVSGSYASPTFGITQVLIVASYPSTIYIRSFAGSIWVGWTQLAINYNAASMSSGPDTSFSISGRAADSAAAGERFNYILGSVFSEERLSTSSSGFYTLYSGGINATSGANTTRTAYCRTSFVTLRGDEKLYVTFDAEGYEWTGWAYSGVTPSSDATHTLSGNAYQSGSIPIVAQFSGEDTCFRFGFRRTDGAALTTDTSDSTSDYYIIQHALHIWKAPTVVEENEYYVGPNQEYTSITKLFQDLAADNNNKTIYVEAGNYNIFAEYLDAGVPSPPDGTSTNDYSSYCVNIPNNTTLIGLGEVNLNWDAPSDLSQLDAPAYDAASTYAYGDYCTQSGSVWCCKTAITTPEAFDSSKWIEMRAITAIESKIWSVLNAEQNVTVDNFTITGKNVRYLIHDDPHNAYTGTTHIYKNLRLSRQSNNNGYGFSTCIGMGYVNDGHYTFENIVINNALTTNASFAIGGHEGQTDASGRNYHGADITIKNCVLVAAGPYALQFQTISHNAGQQRIRTFISNCYIGSKILLDALSTGSGTQQYFDIAILNSGNPDVVTVVSDNPYPVNVYQSESEGGA